MTERLVALASSAIIWMIVCHVSGDQFNRNLLLAQFLTRIALAECQQERISDRYVFFARQRQPFAEVPSRDFAMSFAFLSATVTLLL